MSNITLKSLQAAPRIELHDLLGLTGAEISLNDLPAGAVLPFVHHHVENEEIYIVLEGQGEVFVDDAAYAIKAGDVFKIDPAGQRCIKAAADSAIKYICVQVKAGSLKQFTMTDAGLDDVAPKWL